MEPFSSVAKPDAQSSDGDRHFGASSPGGAAASSSSSAAAARPGEDEADIQRGDEIDFECHPCEDEQGETGGMKPRVIPRSPTPQEVADHEIDHYPYRSWCRACVAAAGRSDKHLRREAGEDPDAIPTIAMDYAFFCESGEVVDDVALEEKGYAPIIIMRSKPDRLTWSDVVRCKGPQDPHAVDVVTKHILQSG